MAAAACCSGCATPRRPRGRSSQTMTAGRRTGSSIYTYYLGADPAGHVTRFLHKSCRVITSTLIGVEHLKGETIILYVCTVPQFRRKSFKANPPMISSVFVSPPSCCIVPQFVLYRTPGCYDTWWDGHASSPPAVAMPDVVRRPAGKNGCDRRAAGTNHAQIWGVAKRR
eukprot:COSAG01_NODE_11622_length_1893_cov_1.485507_1_plen_169_part_00